MGTQELDNQRKLFDCANAIESLKCLKCGNFETHNLAHLKQHVQKGHIFLESDEKIYNCKDCRFQTHSSFVLSRHRLSKFSERVEEVACEIVEENTVLHIRGRYTNWYKCDYCSYAAPSNYALDIHVKTVHTSAEDLLHKCEDCSYATKYLQNLRSHIVIKHTAQDKIHWFHCGHCSYKGASKHNLKMHICFKHANKTHLKCDEAQSKQALKSYTLKTHEDSQPLECAEGSSKYGTKYKLTKHVRSVHGERKSWKCEHCTFMTRYQRSLKNHIVSEHGRIAEEKWFKCEQCSFKYKTNWGLKHHVGYKHANNKCFKCDHCSFETKYERSLKFHKFSKHYPGRGGPIVQIDSMLGEN